jgi:hypothetical protein
MATASRSSKTVNKGTPKAMGLPMAKPETVGMSSARLKSVNTAIQQYIDKKTIPLFNGP